MSQACVMDLTAHHQASGAIQQRMKTFDWPEALSAVEEALDDANIETRACTDCVEKDVARCNNVASKLAEAETALAAFARAKAK